MDFSNLTAFLSRLTNWRIPGIDCIIIKDGRQIYRHTSGFADIEKAVPMCGSETYNMWSNTKVLTCVSALMLFEKGLFALTDNLSEYMPEFSLMSVKKTGLDGKTEIVEATKKILIRDLFTMTTGFSYDIDTPYINEVKKSTNGRCPTLEIARAIAKSPLEFEPGTHWRYGLSHDILAALVEVVSGMKFSDYIQKNIFDPLEMNDSTFRTLNGSDRLMMRMARQYCYNYELDRAVPTDNSCSFKLGTEYDSGGAGLISTVDDYVKFADTLANGGQAFNGVRLLSDKTINLMKTNALNTEQLNDVTWATLKGYGYGLGVRTMIDPIAGGSPGSYGEFGWGGAAGTYLIVDPELHLTVFYAQHMLESQDEYVVPRLRNIIYTSL